MSYLMGNAALCSYLRALHSTGISGFTKPQLKLRAQSSCLVIFALIREAAASGEGNAKCQWVPGLLRASWHVPCRDRLAHGRDEDDLCQ